MLRTRSLFFFLLSLLFLNVTAAQPRKVIIDTDPGTDDAMAILLALDSPELDVQALTVVPGNVTAAQGLDNALKLVSLAGRCDVPVAAGAQHPLNQKLVTAEFWHGLNGLANIDLPSPKCRADPRFGPDLIIELVHNFRTRLRWSRSVPRPTSLWRSPRIPRSCRWCMTW